MNSESPSYAIRFIIGIIAVVIIALAAYYLGKSNAGNNAQNQVGAVQSETPAASTPLPEVTKEEIPTWKTYTYSKVAFKYPVDWKAEAGFTRDSAGKNIQDSVIFSPEHIDIKTGTTQRIDVGGPYANCDAVVKASADYQCKMAFDIPVYTKAKDPAVMRVFNALAGTAVDADESGLKVYTNTTLGYEVTYPKTLGVVANGKYPPAPESAAKATLFQFQKSSYKDSTIQSAEVGITTTKTDCSMMADGTKWLQDGKTVTRSGTEFTFRRAQDAGAGNYYTTAEYSVMRNGLCYRIGMLVHGLNPGTIYTDKKTIDATAALNTQLQDNMERQLDNMVATFTFTK